MERGRGKYRILKSPHPPTPPPTPAKSRILKIPYFSNISSSQEFLGSICLQAKKEEGSQLEHQPPAPPASPPEAETKRGCVHSQRLTASKWFPWIQSP